MPARRRGIILIPVWRGMNKNDPSCLQVAVAPGFLFQTAQKLSFSIQPLRLGRRKTPARPWRLRGTETKEARGSGYFLPPAATAAAAIACWAFICSTCASSTWRLRLVPVFFAYHSTSGEAMKMEE